MAIPNHFDLLQQFRDKFGLPDKNDDNVRREWKHKFAQTLAARFPAEGWGVKRNGPGREENADVIATRSPFNGVDILDGNSGDIQWITFEPLPAPQEFIEVVPQDFLAATTPVPGPLPEPEPEPEPGLDFGAAILAIDADLDAINGSLAQLEAVMAKIVASLDAIAKNGLKLRF